MAKDAVYQAFGKKLAELTADERTRWRRAVRMASYYRKHERNKAQARKDQSWRKVEILEVLGWPAACAQCGYEKYIGALDFHHLDPSGKVGAVMNVKRADAIDEARKCVLLCKNCHCEAHRDMRARTAGRPAKPMHHQVAAYLRAVGVTWPGDVVSCSEPSSRSIVLMDNGGAVGRLGDGTICEEAEHVNPLRYRLPEPVSIGVKMCKTSGTAQCTCPPNGICNDCTIDVALW